MWVKGSLSLPDTEKSTFCPLLVTVIGQVAVNGSRLSSASSKFSEREAIDPSGLVTPPSHSPLNVGREADVVGVDGKPGVAAGATVGEAQADSAQIIRKVKKKRMRYQYTPVSPKNPH